MVVRKSRIDSPQGRISIVHVCQWRRVQQKEKYVLRTVHGYPQMGKNPKWYILCTLFPQGVQCLGKSQNPQILAVKKPDNSYNPDLSFNALNGEIMPDLYTRTSTSLMPTSIKNDILIID